MAMHSTLHIYFHYFYDCTNIFNHINFKKKKHSKYDFVYTHMHICA